MNEPWQLNSTDNPKMLRESLCRIQAFYTTYVPIRDYRRKDIERIQSLIDEIDRHRPLGPDGKHGDRHTETCGCEDK